MNFTCNNCQKRYSIADEKVRGKTVKVRCKNCQSVISVEGPQLPLEESTRVVSLADLGRLAAQERSLAEPEPAAPAPVTVSPTVTAPPVAKVPAAAPQMPWDDEPTRAAPLRAPASPWFVMVRSKQEGPLDEGGLRELIASGAVNGRSFFWQQGMADWKRGLDVPELAGLFAPPPAPEPPAPPPPPMDDPEPAPAPARAARGAAARREPEPQSYLPEPEPPPEEEQPQQQAWAPEEQEPPQQQAWAPDESQQDAPEQQDYSPEPAARAQPQPGRRGQAASTGPLNDDQLFSDLDLPGNRDGDGADDLADAPGGANYPEPDAQDPYGAQGGEDEGEPPPPVDDKRRSSVKKKAPAPRRSGSAGKKVALGLLLLLVLGVGVPFVLDMTGVMPLRVRTHDAQGNPVEYSYFSAAGVSALADKLMGRAPPAPKAAPPAPAPKAPEAAPAQPEPAAAPEGGADANAPAAGTEAGTESGAAAPPAGGPQQAAKDAAPAKAAEPLPDSPPEEEVERVVEEAQASFQECVQAELKKNPSFRGGKVKLTATVANTGEVKEAALSPKSRERSPVGTCIRERAKGMVFSAFSGEDVDLEIEVDLSNKL